MCKRILMLLCVTLTVTACAHGVKQTPAPSSQVPNVDIPADLLARKPQAIPDPASGSRSDLLSNHVQAMGIHHALAIDFTALVCAITGQQGITINGKAPARPAWCADAPRSQGVEHGANGPSMPVKRPVDNLGPSDAP